MIDEILKHAARVDNYALDLETLGPTKEIALNPLKNRILGMSLAAGERAWWLPFTGPKALPFRETMDALAPLLNDESKICWTHNGVFDLKCLMVHRVPLRSRIGCTMIAAWMLNENLTKVDGGLALKGESGLVMQEFNHFLPEFEDSQLGGNMFGRPVDEYAEDDARWTLRLGKKLIEKIEKEGLAKCFWDLEMPVLRVVAKMELDGITVDLPFMWEAKKKVEAEARSIESRIRELAGSPVLVSSHEQMSRLIYEKLGMQPLPGMKRNTKGYYSTAEEIVAEYAEAGCEAAEKLIDFRELATFRDRYLTPLIALGSDDSDRRVRTNFNQIGTQTGRFSSSDPNLQNVPKEGDVKAGFIAGEGCSLICADYDQLELRLMAHRSQEPEMMRAYLNGEDIHKKTMTELNIGERKIAKETNFGLIYGMGAEKFKKQLWKKARIRKDVGQCALWRDGFFRLYKGLPTYYRQVENEMHETGMVTTLLGRHRHLKRLAQADDGKAFRIAVNYTIQGSGADLILLAMRNIDRELEKRAAEEPIWGRVRQLLQVHDELVVEAPDEIAKDAAALVTEKMESAVKLSLPVKVKTGVAKRWSEAKA